MKDHYIWVSLDKGGRNGITDILAGWKNEGGYHIACMLLFCEQNQKKFDKFRQTDWLKSLKNN